MDSLYKKLKARPELSEVRNEGNHIDAQISKAYYDKYMAELEGKNKKSTTVANKSPNLKDVSKTVAQTKASANNIANNDMLSRPIEGPAQNAKQMAASVAANRLANNDKVASANMQPIIINSNDKKQPDPNIPVRLQLNDDPLTMMMGMGRSWGVT
jgi:hypothetical protein